MGTFDGKVAIVTGGNSGLGRATAEAFARQGAKVVLAARREALGREVEASIRAEGGEATFVQCDVTEEEQVRALVERAVQMYGRLDYAYNNAWAPPRPAPITQINAAEYEEQSAALRGVFWCMKYEVPALIAAGGGAIVNCSSLSTMLAQPGVGAYAAMKAGVEMVTRTAAHEYAGQNIRVNSVCTGTFDTPMSRGFTGGLPKEVVEAFMARVALRRYGRTDELAQAVLFLCSDQASFITGVNLVVDGGYRLT